MSARFVRAVAAGVAAASLVLVAPARAQAPGAVGQGIDVDFAALTSSKVGQWADYKMEVPGRTDASQAPKVRYALVEKTPQKLGLEIDTTTPKGELDMRLDFGSGAPDTWKMTAGKMKMGDKVIDFPPQELASAPPIKKGDAPGQLVGTESVTTPAGTFACKHYRKTMGPPPGAKAPPGQQLPPTITMDLWMSEKVAPTGLVKSSLGPMSMVLVGTGKGADAKLK